MNSVSDLTDTVAPKSDQLNADDLLTGEIEVTIEDVKRGTKDQPVSIIIGNGRQPYKPCKIMRRVLIAAWGKDGTRWAGRSMRLFCDESVSFGGVKMGGIRISHVSHIEKPIEIMLTMSRCRKSLYVIKPLETKDYSRVIAEYWALSEEERIKRWELLSQDEHKAIIESPLQG